MKDTYFITESNSNRLRKYMRPARKELDALQHDLLKNQNKYVHLSKGQRNLYRYSRREHKCPRTRLRIPKQQGGFSTFCDNYYYENDIMPPQLDWLEHKLNIPLIGYHGDILDFAVIIFDFVNSISNVKSLKDFFLPVFRLIKDITGRTYTQVIKKFARDVYAIFSMVFGMVSNFTRDFFEDESDYSAFIQEHDDVPVAQSDTFASFIGKIKELNGQKKYLLNSEFSHKFSNFCGMILALPIFKTKESLSTLTMLGFSKAYVYRLRKEHDHAHSIFLLDNILDTLVFFVDKVYLAVKKENFMYIFTESEELMQYDSEFTKVQYYSNKMDLICNVIKEDGECTTLDDYMRDVESLKYKNSIFLKQFKHDSHIYGMMRAHKIILEKISLAIFDKMKVNSEREPTLGFVMYGSPGIGKSTCVYHTAEMLYENAYVLKRTSRKFKRESIYHYNEEDKYFSGFRTEHECIWMDDLGQLQPKLAEANGGGGIRKSCNLINSVPYVTEQPDVENKGMIPFQCKYMFVTTNVRDAGIADVFREESGAKRRFIFLDWKVKDGFQHPGTTMLKGCADPTQHEMWLVLPRKYINVGFKTNEMVWDHSHKRWVSSSHQVSYLTMREYQIFLRDEVQAPHYTQNDTARACVDHFIDSGLCEKCQLNASICYCNDELLEQANAAGDTDDEDDYLSDKDDCNQEVPEAQSGYHVNDSWIKVFVKVFGWKGIIKLLLGKIEFEWHRFTSNLDSMYKKHRYRANIAIGIGATLSVVLMLRQGVKLYRKMGKLFNDDEPNIQGNIPTSFSAPKESANPWVITHSETKLTKIEPRTCTMDQLSKLVTKNCVVLRANLPNQMENYIRALGVHGCTLIVPKHWVLEHKDHWNHVAILRHPTDFAIGPSRYKIYIDETNIKFDDSSDICYITHPGFGNFRNISKFMINKRFEGKHEGLLISRSDAGDIIQRKIHGVQRRDFVYKDGINDVYYECKGYYAESEIPTNIGDCGSVYLVNTTQGCIVAGLHIAGMEAKNNRGYLVFCEPTYIDKIVEPVCHSFNGLDLKETYPRCQSDFIEAIHPKDPINDAQGCITVYGDTDGFRPALRSNVCDTIMNEDVREHYGLLENTHVSPKGVSRRECILNNYNDVGEKATFPSKDIKYCTQAIFLWYMRVIKENNLNIPSGPYDRFVGINGLDNVPYIDRLPVKTSGGFTRGGRKDKYLVQVPSDIDHELKYDFDGDLMKEYNLLIQRYSRGERGQVVWNYNFKDEPISHSKHVRSKVRLFNAGPLAFNVLFRQYFMWTIPLFSGKFRHKFGHAIGANPYGKDWRVLYKHITRHGEDNMIAGDYKSFDKKQPAEVLWEVFEILFKIASEHGFSKEDVFIMRGLATDVCYSLCNVFGTLIELQGNNPSGNPLTTILNGIVNITYIMLACKEIAEDNKIHVNFENFMDYVSILTYGDDNVMSSRVSYFNHTNISNKLAKYGLVYTMADKTSESVPFLNIKEVSFLKRSFIPGVNGSEMIAAPLEESSIIKSLHVCTKSDTIEFREQCAFIIYNANLEYFQYGKDKFERENKFLNDLLDKYKLRMYIKDGELPSYHDHLDRFAYG